MPVAHRSDSALRGATNLRVLGAELPPESEDEEAGDKARKRVVLFTMNTQLPFLISRSVSFSRVFMHLQWHVICRDRVAGPERRA